MLGSRPSQSNAVESLFSSPTNDRGAMLKNGGRSPAAFSAFLHAKASENGIGGIGDANFNAYTEIFLYHTLPPALEERMGIKPPPGMIFYGPPGTGKTWTAERLRDLAGAKFAVINGSELMQRYVGESEGGLRRYFDECRRNPDDLHVIFFDEIDATAPNRGGLGHDGSGNSLRGMVSTLLTELNGIDDENLRKRVIVIAATNRLSDVDPALLRPGRLHPSFEVTAPDRDGRLEILEIHTRKLRENACLAADVDLGVIADTTPGFVGATLKAIVDRACMRAIVEYAPQIEEEWTELTAKAPPPGYKGIGAAGAKSVGSKVMSFTTSRAKAFQAFARGTVQVTDVSMNNVAPPVFPPPHFIYGTPEQPQRIGMLSFNTRYQLPHYLVSSLPPEQMADRFLYSASLITNHLIDADPELLSNCLDALQTSPLRFSGVQVNPKRVEWEAEFGLGTISMASVDPSSSLGRIVASQRNQHDALKRKGKPKNTDFAYVRVAQRHFSEAVAFVRRQEYAAPDVIREHGNVAVAVPEPLSALFVPPLREGISSSFRSLVLIGEADTPKTAMVYKAIYAAQQTVQNYVLLGQEEFLCMTDRERADLLLTSFENALSSRSPSVIVLDVANRFFTNRREWPLSYEVVNYLLSAAYWERNRRPTKLTVFIVVLDGEGECVSKLLPLSSAAVCPV